MVVFNRGYNVNLSLLHVRIRLMNIRCVQMKQWSFQDVPFRKYLTIQHEIRSVERNDIEMTEQNLPICW